MSIQNLARLYDPIRPAKGKGSIACSECAAGAVVIIEGDPFCGRCFRLRTSRKAAPRAVEPSHLPSDISISQLLEALDLLEKIGSALRKSGTLPVRREPPHDS